MITCIVVAQHLSSSPGKHNGVHKT